MNGNFIVFTGPLKAEVLSISLPELGSCDILIEAEASLISAGTERFAFRQAPFYPFFPGYSLVGRVVAKGDAVKRFSIGERVGASAPHGSLVVCDERMAFAVPEGVLPEHATFLTVGATALHAVRLAQLGIGDPLLIVGQGLIGLLATQIARFAGAAPVIGIDVDKKRLEIARTLGADFVYEAGDEGGLGTLLAALPGGGVAATVDLSGASGVMELGVRSTRRRGRVVATALNPGGGNVDLYGLASFKGISLVGGYFNARPWRLDALEVTPPQDWPPRPASIEEFEGSEVGTSAGDTAMILRMIALGRLSVQPLISDVVLPPAAPELFAKLPDTGFLGGVINWSGN